MKIPEVVSINKTTDTLAFRSGNEGQGFELFSILHDHFCKAPVRHVSGTKFVTNCFQIEATLC